jgi:L-threonylcarbamoyladenylate synthase
VTSEILSTHTPAFFDAAVKRAAELLRAGEAVALPTETVYGLAANALNEKAVKKIFRIKGRPANNPIIVHVASVEMAKACTTTWPATAERLARAFWPGPLTLVLPCAKEIPGPVTAGGQTVGVRWPGHPFIQAVIRECGFPLAAPSANLSGQVSPTSAEHVRKQLGDKIALIVDGGQSQIGIESTVLDLTVSPPQVLRPGMIHPESLAAVVENIQQPTPTNSVSASTRQGWCRVQASSSAGARAGFQHPKLKSPGLLKKHYSPKARLFVLSWRDDADLNSQLSTLNAQRLDCHVIAHTLIPSAEHFARVSVIPHDAKAFARVIYAELHRCDAAGAGLIVVETPPASPEWSGIADRLRRASA